MPAFFRFVLDNLCIPIFSLLFMVQGTSMEAGVQTPGNETDSNSAYMAPNPLILYLVIVFRGEENIISNQKDSLDFYDQVIAPYKGQVEVLII